MNQRADMATLKTVLIIVGVLCGLFVVTACEFAELIFYEHKPSEHFYQTYDVDIPELRPFIEDEICFVVSLKATNHRSKYIVWLGLYTSKENKKVNIKRAILLGDNLKEESILNQPIVLDEKPLFLNEKPEKAAQLLTVGVKLFIINGELLERAYGTGGDVRLRVFYEIDGKEGEMNYELIRRMGKYPVFPT